MINILRYLCCFKKKISDENIKMERIKRLPLYGRYSKLYIS